MAIDRPTPYGECREDLLQHVPLRNEGPPRAPPSECVEHTDQQAQARRPGQVPLHKEPKRRAAEDHDRSHALPLPSHDTAKNHQEQGERIELLGQRQSPWKRKPLRRHGMSYDKPRDEHKVQEAKRPRNPAGYVDTSMQIQIATAFQVLNTDSSSGPRSTSPRPARAGRAPSS